MLKYFSPPHASSEDFYENARFRLTWNINLFGAIALFPVMLASLTIQANYFLYYLLSFLLLIGSMVALRFSRKIKVPALIVASLLFIIVLTSMFSVNKYLHLVEPFWILLIVLYVYFVGGKTFGVIFLTLDIVLTGIYFLFFLNQNLEILGEIETDRLISTSVEFLFCMMMFGYVLHQFMNSTRHAERELLKMNEALREEKELVEHRNQEKTILLQEIHHRVKNNLQIVMSLLRMQANKIESEETKEHFADAINRVLTMSLIHQRLYESDNLSAVDFSDYLEALSTDILRSSPQGKHIQKELSIQVKEIGMKSIVPIALIITELISNSAKHAFTSIDEPKIMLRVNAGAQPGSIEMRYSDNGVWKSATTESFGMQLIEALTEQLEGSYEFGSSAEGTWFQFAFLTVD